MRLAGSRYAPLSETPYSSQAGVDYWALALFVLGIGSVSTAINIIATVLCLRAPNMTLRRLPLFTWINFVNAFIVILALPVLNAGLAMLLIDRRLGGHFFLVSPGGGGGSAIMWQHIFWAFGHPEVYILALPAFGIISEVIPVFSRKPIFGYEFVAGSSVAIAFLSFGVWAHHMFTVGLGHMADIFFVGGDNAHRHSHRRENAELERYHARRAHPVLHADALLPRVPVPIPLRRADRHRAHPSCRSTGRRKTAISSSRISTSWSVGADRFRDPRGRSHYWFPKMSGRMLSERIGKWTFWLMAIGFNMTFIIQHFLGLPGMPRRVLHLSRTCRAGAG